MKSTGKSKEPPSKDESTTSVPGTEAPLVEEGEEASFGAFKVRYQTSQQIRRCNSQADMLAQKRIFTFASKTELIIQAVAILAACASGAGIALQNLIFGQFVTVITDFTNGNSTPGDFRDKVAELAYVSPLSAGYRADEFQPLLRIPGHRAPRPLLHLQHPPDLRGLPHRPQYPARLSQSRTEPRSGILRFR
jgi:hypothetical protein